MKGNVMIRPARPEDAKQLLAIYAPYVTDTAITFEYDVPTLDDFSKRMESVMARYPYLVAEWVSGLRFEAGDLLGYAYAGPFKARAAYDWSVETSIYLKMGCKGLGLGRRLYEALEQALAAQNIRNLYACIGRPKDDAEDIPEIDDPYLTMDSVDFHEHMGYRQVGHFAQCGYKFSRWYDMVWMEKFIDVSVGEPKAVQWPLSK